MYHLYRQENFMVTQLYKNFKLSSTTINVPDKNWLLRIEV